MFYYLYEIRNNLNGKIYVGVHKTKSMDDGYMGSGKRLHYAFSKYGAENFTKRIIEQFENAAVMFAREKEVVTDEFLLREDVYNLRRGGFGGFDYLNKDKDVLVARNKRGRRSANKVHELKYGENWRYVIGKMASDRSHQIEIKKKRKKTREANGTKSDASWMNMPEVNERRKEKFKEIGHSQGEKNSQAGTLWITNETDNKKIKKNVPVPEGWRKGRIV